MAMTQLKSPDAAARWLTSWVSGALRTDSRLVQPGDAFIAWPGYAHDGRHFVAQALAAGAATCLVEQDGVAAFHFQDARIASLPGLKSATGVIADAFYGQPSDALRVIASTGTNGKTSTAWWTAQALSALGQRCGVIGTLGVGEPPDRIAPTGLTTPDPVLLQATLRGFVDGGMAACAIEASSIGIVEQRLAGTRVDTALFTNFTQDHLDYHGSMEAYWAAKRGLFGWPGLRHAVVNIDDLRGARLALELQGALDVWTYSVQAPARLRAKQLRYIDGGLAFELCEGDERVAVRSRLIGDYNASNLLAVIGGLRAGGVSLADAASVVPVLTPVPGRMQRVNVSPPIAGYGDRPPEGAAPDLGRPGVQARAAREDQPEVVVDYAHTPDALDKVLLALKPLATARGGQLVCVFGCGGNRDAAKRPLMGGIAAARADRVIVTSDNPRHEDPAAIVAQIRAGITRVDGIAVIEDRAAAIAQALREAQPADVVLIAGKGHEDYQEVAGVKHPFSDVEQARLALESKA
jgi:UDP-N-acetylmuramoyl-L-alanyl-D-glutamate--2,6-diaminopimelate ligase